MIEADEGGNAYIKRSTDGSGHRSGEIYQNDLTPGKKMHSFGENGILHCCFTLIQF